MKRHVKRAGLVGIGLIALVAGLAIVFHVWTDGPQFSVEAQPSAASSAAVLDRPLRVMTLNIAHGRRDGLHQALLKRKTIESNLDRIASVLVHEKPHIVALQEADGPSLWSGRFNHVRHLASGARFSHFFRGAHIDAFQLSYGTALLSQFPLRESLSIAFAPSPPTPTKGFVVSTIGWPDRDDIEVTVVSVHLDFARASVRRKQVEEMIARLIQRKQPLIVMGDFNCGFSGDERSLAPLSKKLGLTAYKPAAPEMTTFPSSGSRLDWILISDDLEVTGYRTLEKVLSDHRAVIAELRLARGK